MKKYFVLILIFNINLKIYSQVNTIVIDPTQKHQIIDGFGSHQGNEMVNQSWFLDLFYNDIEASIYRVDLTPRLKSPYSDLSYFSPWFMGSGTVSPFNLEDMRNPNGPENNRVRTYTGPTTYGRNFGGRSAPIAVMGPNIEVNVNQFVYNENKTITEGVKQKIALGDFKLIGSIWSPLPWVKVASGNIYPENWWPGPVANTAWPFIWGGNFSGGKLDVSNTPLAVFNDSNLGGTGNTSSLTQYARSTAAYILGYQRYHKASFYAISIQNELNFETFYNSMTFPLSSQYITAVKLLRAEFDKYPELRNIKIMGPEDLLGGDAYGMWEYAGPTHKNLQYLQNIAKDSVANRAIDFYCVHGYASDGVTAAGSSPQQWSWWVNGWSASPAAGIPANVKGILSLNKKSWMTETSGENRDWIFPKSGFPGEGALGIGIRIHQALVHGRESAWVYWTFADSNDAGQVSDYGLTNQTAGKNAPKYVAAKHYYKLIRPGSYRVNHTQTGNNGILASAYTNDQSKATTIVLINTTSSNQSIQVTLPNASNQSFKSYTSRENNYWNEGNVVFTNNASSLSLPPYSMITVYGKTNTTAVQELASNIEVLYCNANPIHDRASIFYKLKNHGDVKFSLFNAVGVSVHEFNLINTSFELQQWELDNKNYTAGIYYLKMATLGQVKTIPLIMY